MKTINFFLLAPAFFVCTSLYAQVTIGGLDAPRAGALLDLNSTAKGGLLLSNVNITHLDSIPAGTGYFPGVNTPALRDVNPGLRGAIVYNTNETTGAGVYVWNGKRWRPAATPDDEQILFTIRTTTDNTYSIPTAGYVNGTYNHAYDWDITVDGQPIATEACPDGHCTGAGGGNFDGIELTGLSNNVNHQIRITPHGGADPGWGNAFGYCDSIFGAHTVVNKQKLISIDAPLTTMAFAPKISENAASATWMFARLFIGCSKLTTPTIITDTYKLPETITNLANFLYDIHSGNSTLAKPIDLTPLSGWFNGNQKIKNLSSFLYDIHANNSALATPIDLAPLSGWFKGNTSIENLSNFLGYIHYYNGTLAAPVNLEPLSGWFKGNTSITDLSGFLLRTHNGNTALAAPINLVPLKDWFSRNNSIKNLSSFLAYSGSSALTTPIDLESLSGWFNGNNSITNLSGFLTYIYNGNTALAAPIDLEPLKDWFKGNTSIESLSSFLYGIHNSNVFVTPIDLEPLKDWFKENNKINNLSNFLSRIHGSNVALATPIDLNPLKDWFNGNTSITNLAGFLEYAHSSNIALLTPIDLEPLKDWFSGNNKINNLSYFLSNTHTNNNALAAPIDLTPLSGWFKGNSSITNLTGFLERTHQINPGFTLTGQFIFPDWIQTMTQNGTAIWNVKNAFFRTFYLGNSQNSNTEPKFEDNITVLSQLGTPTVINEIDSQNTTQNKGTYTNRDGITPSNNNWK